MLSYDIVEHGKPLQKALRETPRPQGSEVLVRVLRSGVCHTDLHLWEGYFDLGGGRRYYIKDRGQVPPITLGHEPYGVVEALGPDAEDAEPRVAVGAKGIVYPWIGCGTCAVCRAGQDNYCLAPRFIGAGKPGAYATHILVPHPKYLVAADGLDPSLAATLAYFLYLQGDAVGLLTFDEQVRDYLPARHRVGHLRQLMLALERPASGKATDLAGPLERIMTLIRKRGIGMRSWVPSLLMAPCVSRRIACASV